MKFEHFYTSNFAKLLKVSRLVRSSRISNKIKILKSKRKRRKIRVIKHLKIRVRRRRSHCFRYFLFDNLSYLFINQLMRNGNRSNAINRYLDALFLIKKLTLISPGYFLRKCVFNARSLFNVSTIYRGRLIIYKANFMSPQAQLKRAIKVVLQMANKLRSDNHNLSYSQCLAFAILNSFFKRGPVFKQIRNIHKKIKDRKLQFPRPSFASSLRLRFKRTRKTKGFYYLNRYGLYKRIVPLD